MTSTARTHRSTLRAFAARAVLVAWATRALGAPVVGSGPNVSKQPPNVLLITMEATRPDHLGCYDDPRAQTPALDRLRKEGALFEQAIATAPLTLPSHASILTGLYPPRHGVRDNEGFTLDRAKTTLAQHLKAQGYATSASVGNALLAGAVGLNRGFDSFAAPKSGSRSATNVADDAIAAIDRVNGPPFFLWVQFDDVHAPYLPPPSFQTRFAARPYDGEIAWVDSQIGRILDHLRDKAMLDNTIVVATAAEGESLYEHGEETHGLLVYDATLRVPLLLRYPPKARSAVFVRGVVSLIDLAPTILDVLGLPPIPGVQGTSFAQALQGVAAGERAPVYAESLFAERAFGWAPLHALRTGKRKYIDAPAAELYDTQRDPSETIELVAKEKDAASSYRAQLRELRRSIGDTGSAAPSGGSSRRDPKSLVAVGNLFLAAKAAIAEGHLESAVPMLEQALKKDPMNPGVTALLATLRGQPARPSAAAANTFASQWSLGNALFVEGKLDEAAKAFRAALALNPGSAPTHYALGNILQAKGDAAGAEAELRAAVAADPKMADGWNTLGILLDKSKRRSDALDAFSHALSIDPDHVDALFNRAKIEFLESKLPEARRDVDHLLEAHADYAPGLFLDAHLCEAEKNPAGARAALTKLIALPTIDPKMKAAAEDMLKKLGS